MSTDIRALAQAIIDAVAPFAEGADTNVAAKASKRDSADDHKPMALVDADEPTEYTEAELKKMKVKELRALAISLDYAEDEVADASKSDLVAAIIADQEGDVEPADEDEDVDEDDDADVDDDASEYDDMSMAELKAEAKKAGIDGRKVRHMDRDEIIALLSDTDEDADEDEDEAVDEDDDDDDIEDADVDAEDMYTEDELNDMPLAELKELAEDYDIEIPKRTRRNKIVEMILDAQDEILDEDE